MKEKNFAFIYETPFLEYNLQLNCEIIKIGEEFSKFGYVIRSGMQDREYAQQY